MSKDAYLGNKNEKNVYSFVFAGNSLWLSVKYICSMAWLNTDTSFFILFFCLIDLFIFSKWSIIVPYWIVSESLFLCWVAFVLRNWVHQHLVPTYVQLLFFLLVNCFFYQYSVTCFVSFDQFRFEVHFVRNWNTHPCFILGSGCIEYSFSFFNFQFMHLCID